MNKNKQYIISLVIIIFLMALSSCTNKPKEETIKDDYIYHFSVDDIKDISIKLNDKTYSLKKDKYEEVINKINNIEKEDDYFRYSLDKTLFNELIITTNDELYEIGVSDYFIEYKDENRYYLKNNLDIALIFKEVFDSKIFDGLIITNDEYIDDINKKIFNLNDSTIKFQLNDYIISLTKEENEIFTNILNNISYSDKQISDSYIYELNYNNRLIINSNNVEVSTPKTLEVFIFKNNDNSYYLNIIYINPLKSNTNFITTYLIKDETFNEELIKLFGEYGFTQEQSDIKYNYDLIEKIEENKEIYKK